MAESFRVTINETKYTGGIFADNGTEGEEVSLLERALDMLDDSYGIRSEAAWSLKDLQNERNWVTNQSATDRFTVDLSESWDLLHYFYHFRGPVKNITNNLDMLMGNPTAAFDKDSDEREWKEIGEANRFPARWGEIKKNTILLNDYFTTAIPGEKITGLRPVKVAIRNIEPWHIRDVVRNEKDPEEVTGYIRNDNGMTLDPEKTVHHILDKIGNPKRGIPLFNGCLRELHYAYKLMENIHWIYHIRARIPAVRKVQGGSVKVEAEKTRYSKLPAPGHVPIENAGVEWKFPNIEGPKGAKEAWMLYMMGIAGNFNLPVFLVTSDFSNHALASTLAADSPTIRLIESYRNTLSPQFKRVVEAGLGRPVDVTFNWPPIIEHDPKKLAERFEIEIRNGLVSKETAATALGHDWEKEAPKIQKEIHQAMKLVNNDGIDADAEKEKE